MTHHPAAHLRLTPYDEEAPRRAQRLRRLGLGQRPDPAFDAFARRLTEVTQAPYGMVNFIDETRQFFAGLHTPAGSFTGTYTGPRSATAGGGLPRSLARDHGYCPHVVVRRKALVLEDVCDYPRFAGNPVVDEIGIRSYLGAPLIDRTGTVLGTVCVADTRPRPWGRAGLDTIKAMAAELVEQIHRHEDGTPPAV
ncbi:histidine kinase [Streptomyces sp. CC53]|uniref:GAF domain-containing protein n=1 Tax=unclassified Streptomyces TaxID=2593676 RepID=UPI0008DE70D4|nr:MULTISPECIES: GAF domain-containing protein [unclassified Streptomyces]OII59920.1 histidine kinase [Streptomyces sp. CC53]OII68121.1 histidine kinase [Streptomyces sp. CC77]